MPELPEVETIQRDLKKAILGSRIERVTVVDPRIIRQMSPGLFKKSMTHVQIHRIMRRGKAIIFQLSPPCQYLVIQLMMTGQLILNQEVKKVKSTKIIFLLSNKQYLLYNDQRLFGRLNLVDRWEDLPYFQGIGPEPLGNGFNVSWLCDALHNRHRPIKSLLMDHRFLAGIGNIYASEILFSSSIHPLRTASSLRQNEVESLYRCTQSVLREAIRCRGTSMNTYFDSLGKKGTFKHRIKVYGREGQACCQCSEPLVRIVLAGRSTFFCQTCQK